MSCLTSTQNTVRFVSFSFPTSFFLPLVTFPLLHSSLTPSSLILFVPLPTACRPLSPAFFCMCLSVPAVCSACLAMSYNGDSTDITVELKMNDTTPSSDGREPEPHKNSLGRAGHGNRLFPKHLNKDVSPYILNIAQLISIEDPQIQQSAIRSSLLMRQRARWRHGRCSRRLADTAMAHGSLSAVDADVHGRDFVSRDADAVGVEPFRAGFTVVWGNFIRIEV